MTADAPGLAEYVRRYVEETEVALRDPFLLDGMHRIVPALRAARDAGRMVFFLGNGGSSATAAHFVNDLSKLTIPAGAGRRFRCVALADDVPTLTAWANDTDYSRVFSEPLQNLAQPGDVVVAISGSGNSANVLRAVETARSLHLVTIGLTGIGGGRLKGMVDIPVVVPSSSMQHVEDVHHLLMHLVCAYFRDEAPAPGGPR